MATVQEPGKNQDLANLDLTKVAALQQKRTLAFVNHFAVTTVQFLNHFMKKCEHKLMQFERKLEKVEAALVLLETRLSSIPEVNTTSTLQKGTDDKESESQQDATPSTASTSHSEESPVEPSACSENKWTDPRYDRFIKMVEVGVPLQAVKIQMSLEHLNPEVLDKLLRK